MQKRTSNYVGILASAIKTETQQKKRSYIRSLLKEQNQESDTFGT